MNANLMLKAREGLAKHPKCGAHSRRSGKPCQAPAMPNGRCRMHGGLSPGAPSGEKHWNYKHGNRSKAAIETRRETRAIIRAIRELVGRTT